MTAKITGRVVSGLGQGAQLTQLDWARKQFVDKLGIDPFPGTLNVMVDASDASTWQQWKNAPGVEIVPPNADWCNARAYPIRVAGRVNGAIILPEVNGYAPTQIEIIANVSLRETLQLNDGDALALELENETDARGNADARSNADARINAQAYLRAHNVMTLATHGPEGLWAAAVFYVHENFDLYFLSSPSTRHSLNLAANPRVAVTIQEDYDDWRAIKGIQLEGNVTRLEGLEQARAILLYGKKFSIVGNIARAPAEIARAFSRVAWYRVTPTRVYFVDNSQAFGHRDEIALET
ncbi:MAG: hypothetical protein B6D41_10040 [Chloroflexi bacterium UTCFX4]|nr:MAG: hypothetical protein B6D41_10040 [Chloroflexi bacterium UTCFX4]